METILQRAADAAGPTRPLLMSWASILEPGTRDQACATSEMPFIHPYVALIPDAHLGLGATVGSVIPTDGAILPAAVGVDIGCGMIACRTRLTLEDVRRKEATDAHTGVRGPIPGSMGTKSYVVTGRGNTAALCSAPHGAGRAFSRSAAKRTFTRADLDREMTGIVWGESDAFLDEIPQALQADRSGHGGRRRPGTDRPRVVAVRQRQGRLTSAMRLDAVMSCCGAGTSGR